MGMHESDAVTALTAQIETLTKKSDNLTTTRPTPVMLCETCGDGHVASDYQIIATTSGTVEHVDLVGNVGQPQGNPYENPYNPSWRNRPNFLWSNPG